MKDRINIGEVIKIGLILFAITALSAALLAFVNAKTAPLIELNSIEKEKAAMRKVMPGAADFEKADDIDISEVSSAYIALDSEGTVIGACVITETSGYDVGIQTVTGIGCDLKVTGVEVISMNETPGLGAKAKDESFRSQYNGKSGTIGVSKSSADDENIQAISGATKTSNGVTKGVNLALQTAEILLEGGNE